MTKVLFKKLSKTAKIPKRATEGAAGFDLYADFVNDKAQLAIVDGYISIIPTKIAMSVPKGYVGLIKPRSGWAAKHGVDTMAGVIDSDYRGEVCVILTKHSSTTHRVEHGDRIAQIIFVPVLLDSFEVVDELDDTVRGEDGFGSTGDK